LELSALRRPVVLIVEDEFLLRMNAAEMVGDAGFNVVEAGNADDAIAILEGARTFGSYLPISKCPAQWMA
jgi:CheY-like chemotaxis protein